MNNQPFTGRKRAICFTLNNYTREDVERISALACQFLIFQEEIGQSGTPHLQGYIYGRNGKSFDAWKRLISNRAHIEAARGSPDQNIDYCSKEDSRIPGTEVVRRGEPPAQGARGDLDQVYEMVRAGASEVDIADANPSAYIRYGQGIRRAMLLHRQPRDFMPQILWFYGPTGTGKSRAANELPGSKFFAPTDKFWFDGYDGQDVVIIDDYRRDYCPFHLLLKLLDRYPLQVPVKNGYANFRCRTIVITTPRSIRDTWEGRTEEQLRQLERRVLESPEGGEFYFGPGEPFRPRYRAGPNYAENFRPAEIPPPEVVDLSQDSSDDEFNF